MDFWKKKDGYERTRKMKKFLEEFKKFIMKGNALDLAVGVIIGGAFTSIVNSLNADIITPVLAIFGGVDFSNLTLKLGNGDLAPVLTYGNFLTAVINFLITAVVIFCMISSRRSRKRSQQPRSAHTVRVRSRSKQPDVRIVLRFWRRQSRQKRLPNKQKTD